MRELRVDQTVALDQLRDTVAAGQRRIVMQAPTGFGKTVLAAALVESALSKGKKVLFTVPVLNLIDQTIEMLWSQGIDDVGVIQAHHHLTNWSKPVQVASVQTLNRRELPEADVVLLDECHRWFTCYERWLHKDKNAAWSNVPVIGLSATPWTRGLANWFGSFIKASSTQALIDDELLSPFKVFAPSHPDLSEVRVVAGDYHEGELSEKMSDSAIVADAVQTWLRLGENRPTLCYAVDCAHAKHLQVKFQASGVPCGYQDANTKDADRKAIKRDFHSGAVKVVVNVGTLTTGIDWDVRCISMCRPTKSDMLFVQIIGRGLRTATGKDHCLILDHSSNHSRLGFVTDVDASYTGLLAGKAPQHDNRTEAIRLPKECPQCAYLKPPRMAKCPSCGFVAEVQNSVRPQAGELRELKPKPKPKPVEPDRRTFYAELRAYALLKGHNPKWPAVQYLKKHNEWPPFGWNSEAPARMVSAYTLRWITSRNIAYAKGMAKAQPVQDFVR